MRDYEFEIVDNSEAFIDAMRKAAPQIVEALGIQAQSHTIANIRAIPRVDTGLMANSIAYAVSGKGAVPEHYAADSGEESGSYSGTAPEEPEGHSAVYIGSNVEYFPYQELGFNLPSGAHVPAMNALKRGCEQVIGEAEQIARRIAENTPGG